MCDDIHECIDNSFDRKQSLSKMSIARIVMKCRRIDEKISKIVGCISCRDTQATDSVEWQRRFSYFSAQCINTIQLHVPSSSHINNLQGIARGTSCAIAAAYVIILKQRIKQRALQFHHTQLIRFGIDWRAPLTASTSMMFENIEHEAKNEDSCKRRNTTTS